MNASCFFRHRSPVLLASALLGAAALFAVPAAHAQFFQNSTGITNPVRTITFDEHVFGGNTTLTTQYSDLGVTFSGFSYDPVGSNNTNPNQSGHAIGNFKGGLGATNPFSIFFNAPVTAAGFSFISQPGTTTFQAFLNGVAVSPLSTATTNLTQTNNFFGFQNTAGGFNEIRMAVTSSDFASLTDNLQVGPNVVASAAPEPGTFALLGTGLVPLAGLVARKRRATKNSV